MKALSNQEIRKFITTHFNDSELKTFCFDYFPEVQNNFTAEMRKIDKVMDLITYCHNRQLMTNLLTNLRQERQEIYQQTFNPQDSFSVPLVKTKPRDPRQIFISYSTKDATSLANRLAEDLRAHDYFIWIAPESIVPGEKWGEAIERGLQESGIFILLLTPGVVDSFWVKKEMYAAMRLHERSQMRVLPLDVQACTLPILWEEYQFIPFRNGYTNGWEHLWQALVGSPSTSRSKQNETPQPVRQQTDVAPHGVEKLFDKIQSIPAWMKWGGVVVLMIIFSMGYVIFGGGNDDAGNLPAMGVTIEPTSIGITEITETHTEMPTDIPMIPPTPVFSIGSTRTRPMDEAMMIYVPEGEFMMGNDAEDQYAHAVHLDSYWIDKTEVTNGMYAACVEDVACTQPYILSSHIYDNYYLHLDYVDYPVMYVRWYDAIAYCEWAGGRLPTEAEWEKAAAWDDATQRSLTYPWGDTFDGMKLNFCDSNCPLDWKDDTVNDGYEDTAPVGSYPDGASPYGALDMAGNVWEWTSSLYQSYPYSADDGRENVSSTNSRVRRGGSWFDGDYYVRTASRFDNDEDPASSNYGLGFRCAQE